VGGVSAAVSKTAAAPIERVKLLIQNQVCFILNLSYMTTFLATIDGFPYKEALDYHEWLTQNFILYSFIGHL